MGNMSYCRFSNTASDLSECLDAIYDNGIKSLSASEQKAAADMVRLCEEYLELYSAACGDEK